MTHWQQTLKNAQFAVRYSPDALILDIGTPDEYATWHLDGAINIPIEMPPDLERLNIFIANLLRHSRRRERPIILYSRCGIRSQAMESALLNAGFYNVIDLGGFHTLPMQMLIKQNIHKI